MLADYGADVIWVEPPGGDRFRGELKVPYAVFNRGKRGIVLDLKDDRGREHMDRLLATADVFVESWRPGVAGRLGLGWDALHQRFPALVHTSITGFGPDGPYRDLPGYESLVHAIAGSTAEQAGHRPGPIYQALPFASIGAAMLADTGTLAALYRRGQDGHGRHVETSLLDGALSFLAMLWGDSDNDSLTPPLASRRIRLVAGTFRCGDGEYLGVHTGAVGAFGRLIRVLGLQERIPVAKDGTDMQIPLTPEQAAIVTEEIPEIFAREPRAAWLDKLLKADVCAIPALRPGEIFGEPQPRHNGMVLEVEDPVFGLLQQVAPPVKLPSEPSIAPRRACTVGEHTDKVLAELDAGTRPAPPIPAGPPRSDRPLLDGLKVLDLGAYYAGPYSSRLLADLGADVIKLETTLGDQLRGIPRPFRSCQAGKRGISVNLKDPQLAPALEQLLGWADVITHNMRPGAAERLGVGYEQAQARNPRITYLYAPGWGATGPDALRQSFAPMLSGYAGVSYEVAGKDNDPVFPLGNEDPGNGLLGAVGVLLGLLHSQRTGGSVYVENSQLDATMAHMSHVVRTADGAVLGALRLDSMQTGFSALDRLYETSDGWLALAVAGDDEFARLTEALGVPLRADNRFATAAARQANDGELACLLDDIMRGRPTAHWVTLLTTAGLGAAAPKTENNCRDFHRDPANHASERVAQVKHPVQGVVRQLAHLVRVSGSTYPEQRLPPELGEHTVEVLSQFGYDAGTLAALKARGAVRYP
jgi:crotonobetainyl-CoA:carnitine CoA-transferase CaiB-like acyl-CoA transferase